MFGDGDEIKRLHTDWLAWQTRMAKQGLVMDDRSRHSLRALLTKAGEVLGGEDAALVWMKTPAVGLDGKRPIDVILDSADGIAKVDTYLGRLDWGVYT